MIMVSRHSTLAKVSNVSKHVTNSKEEITTQMMVKSDQKVVGQPLFKNHTSILIWTDKDNHDVFSLHLQRRLSYLRNTCPALKECIFTFDKKDSKDTDIIVIASKRHFPYGGIESSKTWTLILPGNIILSFYSHFWSISVFINHFGSP